MLSGGGRYEGGLERGESYCRNTVQRSAIAELQRDFPLVKTSHHTWKFFLMGLSDLNDMYFIFLLLGMSRSHTTRFQAGAETCLVWTCPEWVWNPPTYLSSGSRGLYGGVKRQSVKFTTHSRGGAVG